MGTSIWFRTTLYIRPYMIATNAVIGVKPADEYQFRILVTPVGALTSRAAQSQLQSVFLIFFDRAAPNGTGHIKAGLNYAMSLHAIVDAHAQDMLRTCIWILLQELM